MSTKFRYTEKFDALRKAMLDSKRPEKDQKILNRLAKINEDRYGLYRSFWEDYPGYKKHKYFFDIGINADGSVYFWSSRKSCSPETMQKIVADCVSYMLEMQAYGYIELIESESDPADFITIGNKED